MARRYGWPPMGSVPPYPGRHALHAGPIRVNDDDFTYITSQELDSPGYRRGPAWVTSPASYYEPPPPPPPPPPRQPSPDPDSEPDILVLRESGRTHNEDFPAYSIGDGKLVVADLRERLRDIYSLSHRQSSNVKMLYKGRSLHEDHLPVREYGVKNNSEILILLHASQPEPSPSAATDDVVVVRDRKPSSVVSGNSVSSAGSSRKKKKQSAKRSSRQPPVVTNHAAPDDHHPERYAPDPSAHASTHASTHDLAVPDRDDYAGSDVSSVSPTASNLSAATASGSGLSGTTVGSGVPPSAAMDKVNVIAAGLAADVLPACRAFVADPPKHKKRREDEYRRLIEMVEQGVLKLDGVDYNGEEEVRLRRRKIIDQCQAALKSLDEHRRE